MGSSEGRGRRRAGWLLGIGIVSACASHTNAQQPVHGFAVERFYPSAPGGGWFVMDDLNISGGLGGAVELTSGYARNPLAVTSADGTQRLTLVGNEAFVDVGAAATYDRYRVYLNFPMPVLVTGNSGTLGPYALTGPDVTLGTNPDTIADPRLGLDMRLWGKPGEHLRIGMGAQLIFPSGDRADYVSDGRYRGMFRLLAAGDSGAYSYAGQAGVHVRPLHDAPAPGSPAGSEFLFGGAVGRRFPIRADWSVVVGPEIFGATAFDSFFGLPQTAAEGLMTGRFERTGRANLRIKTGIGHGLVQHFGAPAWRFVVSVEVFGQLKQR